VFRQSCVVDADGGNGGHDIVLSGGWFGSSASSIIGLKGVFQRSVERPDRNIVEIEAVAGPQRLETWLVAMSKIGASGLAGWSISVFVMLWPPV
jgi:hypothetical protein